VIVGRHAELKELTGALEAARSGRTRNLLLIGEAGTGKSTLLRETEQRAAALGFSTVRTASPEGATEFRYAVIEDIVAGLSPALAHLDGEEATLLAGLSRAANVGPNRVAAALIHLLIATEQQDPLLILADDIHWSDDASRATLALVAGRLKGRSIALIGAARPRPTRDPRLRPMHRVTLGPLDPQSASALLRAGLPPEVDGVLAPQQAARVAAALGGHPLALSQCTRLLTNEQILGYAPLPDPIPLDARLVDAWGGEIATLGERARRAVLAVCVTRGAGPGVLDRVLIDQGLRRADLEPAIRANILVATTAATGEPDLSHPLMSAAIRTVAGVDEVRRLHRSTAEVAEALNLAPAVVITHLAAASEPGDAGAVRRLQAQAERALAVDQAATAARALLTAAELSDSGQDRGRLAAQAARTLLAVSRNLTGAAALVTFLDGAELSPEDQVWAEWLRAEYLAEEDLRESLNGLMHAAELARHVGAATLPQILWSATFAAWSVGDGEAALHLANAYAALAPALRASEQQAFPPWAGLTLVGLTHFQVGDVALAEQLLAEARRMSDAWTHDEEVPIGRLVNVVILDEALGMRRPFSDPRLQRALRRLVGDSGETLAFLRNIQAARALRRGDLQVARALVHEGLDISRAVRFNQNVILRLCTIVRVDAMAGDGDALARHAAELRSLARKMGHVWGLSYALRAEGLLALGEGRLDDALRHLEPLAGELLLGLSASDPVPAGRADLVEALVRSGELDRAAVVAQGLHDTLGSSTDPGARGLLARCSGLVGTGPSARADLEAAVAYFQESAEAFEVARTRLALGELLRRDRSLPEARRELRAAMAEFERMGAAPWEARAKAELRAAGSAVAPAAADPCGTLTAQELRVASEVARGSTNREVAAALFLSPRTVEHHLASAYRKLGVTSRTALAHSLAARVDSPPSVEPFDGMREAVL
jgi:DNA-binding CsgD family transcriptional regulator